MSIGLVLIHFGGHVVWSSYHCGCVFQCVLKNLRNPKISKFQHSLVGQEDILRLDVPMQYLISMDIVNRNSHLDKPIYDNLFREVFLLLLVLLDMMAQVSLFQNVELK